jgi:hypothetical protein
MFTKPMDDQNLAATIADLYKQLEVLDPYNENYSKTVDQLIKLETLKNANKRPKISGDVLATITANLVGIGIIVTHERAHVIATKALGFVSKLR